MKIEIVKEVTINGTKYWIIVDGTTHDVTYTEEDAIDSFNKYVKFYSIPKTEKQVIKSIEI